MQIDRIKERREACRFTMERAAYIPNEDIAIKDALDILAAAFLIGVEKDLLLAAEEIAVYKEGRLCRETERRPIDPLKERHRRWTLALILSSAIYFDENNLGREATCLLLLLEDLAFDESQGKLYEISRRIVQSAGQTDPIRWRLLEEEMPGLTRQWGRRSAGPP